MLRLLVLSFTFFSLGCATYQSDVAPARELLISRQCQPSLKILAELSLKNNGDQLVHLMDYGSALQICEDYKKSNEVFAQAETVADQADYHSVSRVAGATLLNEEMIQYKGDTFEKLFLNVSLALNYMQLGQFDNALVEVRKMNQKFDKYRADEKKNFELNPFSKYLSALIWEADQKYDDACIDFKDAYTLDPSYPRIAQDMLRGCWKARRTAEFDELVKKTKATTEDIKIAKQASKTELIIIFMQGWGPRKQPRSENRTFPQLVSVPSSTYYLKAEVMDTANKSVLSSYRSEPVYNVEKAAMDTLNADYKSLVARRIGSRVAKEVLADQIRQKDKALGQIAWLVMVASERADLRQWSIFPKTVHLVRIPLSAGTHNIRLTGMNVYLNDSEKIPDMTVSLKSGEKKFQLVRSLK